MFNTRQNIHHSKLPEIGKIVIDPFSKDKAITIAYPLNDNVRPYSKGIHTVFIRILKNNTIRSMSGFYFVDND